MKIRDENKIGKLLEEFSKQLISDDIDNNTIFESKSIGMKVKPVITDDGISWYTVNESPISSLCEKKQKCKEEDDEDDEQDEDLKEGLGKDVAKHAAGLAGAGLAGAAVGSAVKYAAEKTMDRRRKRLEKSKSSQNEDLDLENVKLIETKDIDISEEDFSKIFSALDIK